MKLTVIINPKSGLQAVQKNVFKAIDKLKADGWLVDTLQTQNEGDAYTFAQNLTTCDLVMAVGGDGTVNEVVNGLKASGNDVPLAIVPAGTVNDFAHYFKLPTKDQAIYEYLKNHDLKQVDIGRVNGQYFTNVVAAGFISDVGYRVQRKTKKKFGRFAYYFEGVIEALKYMKRANRFKFTIGSNHVELDAYMFIALNSTHLGGLSYFAPQASLEDGFIDLFIIKKTGLIGGFILLVEMLLGRHIDDKNVIYFKVKSFSVDCLTPLVVDIDGERGFTLPVHIDVDKGGLTLAVPKA